MASDNSTVTYRDIPGFPGYRVGDDGSVWSCRGRSAADWRQMKPQIRKRDGRTQVGLYTASGYKMIHVHVLVLLAFVGPRPPGTECCHCDGNKTNNSPSNLRWDTRASNIADAVKHGCYRGGRRGGRGAGVPGERNSNSRFTEAIIRAMRDDYAAGLGCRVLSRKYGTPRSVICRIVKRQAWKHVE